MSSCVWVYLKAGAEEGSIELSIALAKKNLRGIDNFVVCGDRPDGWEGDFIHCPRITLKQYKAITGMRMNPKWRKWVDSINKLQTIIESPLVDDSFLWMYDDTFIVKPTHIDQLRSPVHSGAVRVRNKPFRRKSWREAKRRTFDVLAKRGYNVKNYSTHAPMVYEKSKLAETIKTFEPFTRPRVIESLYGNHHHGKDSRRISPTLFRYMVCDAWPRELPHIINVGNGSLRRYREQLKKVLNDERND